MSKHKKHHEHPKDEEEKKVHDAEEKLSEEVEEVENDLEEQIKTLEDKNLRLLAEFNNYKKRSAQEFDQASKKAKADVFKKMVDTLDGFERALEQECQDQDFKKGMEMIFDKFRNDLTSLGLEEVDNQGKMNHAYHQALMVDQNPDLDDDEIVEVLQKGYKVEDVLVRPSMVKVNQKPVNNTSDEENKKEENKENQEQ